MQLGQPGKWLQGCLLLQRPEPRVGADASVFERDEKSSPWEKPWEGEYGTGDEELDGSINEKGEADVTIAFKGSMKS